MNRDSERSLPEVVAEAIELLTKFSIPLYVNDQYRRPVLFGTGFFVRAADNHFLVSAAHVLDVARTQRVFFYATPNKLRALTGRVLTTGLPDKRDDDLLDIGVMKLSGEAAPPYPEGHGNLAPPGNVEVLSQIAVKIATDGELRSKIGAQGREWAGRFTWDNLAGEQLAFYSQLLKKA